MFYTIDTVFTLVNLALGKVNWCKEEGMYLVCLKSPTPGQTAVLHPKYLGSKLSCFTFDKRLSQSSQRPLAEGWRLLYPKLSKNHKSVQKIIFHKYTVVQYIGVLEGWWHVPAAKYRRDFPKRRFRADFMTLWSSLYNLMTSLWLSYFSSPNDTSIRLE